MAHLVIRQIDSEAGQMRETMATHRAKAGEELACRGADRRQKNEFEEDLGDIAGRLMLSLESFLCAWWPW